MKATLETETVPNAFARTEDSAPEGLLQPHATEDHTHQDQTQKDQAQNYQTKNNQIWQDQLGINGQWKI